MLVMIGLATGNHYLQVGQILSIEPVTSMLPRFRIQITTA